MDPVFKALADPTRRLLLDRLREHNGQTLGELCEHLEMTRQSATQHLDLLVRANLVTVVRRGRERLHYLNPVPIHEIEERWISGFDRPRLHAISAITELLAQKTRGIIRFGDDYARSIHKFIQSDFELPRGENVVRVRGKTESDRKKLVYPKSSARSHAREMSVHVVNLHLLQAQTNVDRLVKPKEIGAASPFIQGGDNVCADLPFLCGASNFFQQFLFVRKIVHPFDDTRVPILWWLVFRIPD